MSSTPTQSNRPMAVSTPFGEDVLLLTEFTGIEQLSSLFQYELVMQSEDDSLDAQEIVGTNITVRIEDGINETRYFNGYVSEFVNLGWGEGFTTYGAVMVPWLWFLTQTSDCRIWQDRRTPFIVRKTFERLGFEDYELKLSDKYPKQEYCVQYRESAFNFVSRLMEEEGIFYYFRHENGKHTMVLGDTPSSYFDIPDGSVEFPDPGHVTDDVNQVLSWQKRFRFMPGAVSLAAFNFKSPSKDLNRKKKGKRKAKKSDKYEIYEWQGRHGDTDRGDKKAKVIMEGLESKQEVANGESTCSSFTPGGIFNFSYHRVPSETGKSYVLKRVATVAKMDNYVAEGSGSGFLVKNEFECLPSETDFRPDRETPQPIVEGPQTAVVVGPKGEEIHVDEFGRVKVHFHWDRHGNRDDKSSCWVRASQAHAGAGFGGIDVPRIGEEVIVDFLEGDPDQPIISGRVYNAEAMPPFELPGGMTRSGMKSNTHKGSGYNEISMDDTAGQEQIRVNGQYDMNTTVGNDQTLIVNNNRTTDIVNNDSITVGNDSVEQVGNDKSFVVGNNMNIQVGEKLVMNAGSSITLKCGASQIKMNSGGVITITGTIITTTAAAQAKMASPATTIVGGVLLSTTGSFNTTNGGITHCKAFGNAAVKGGKVDVVGGSVDIKAGGQITLN